MSSVHYEEQILNAIETMVDDAVARADYDKTIKATIISCLDATIGKYKVKYQDSTFDAYSNNLDVLYAEGSQVNILIPKNDLKQNKIILCAIGQDLEETTTAVETEDFYELIGGNTVNSTEEFSLCSYKLEDDIILYDKENEINLINFDELAFNNAVAEGTSFLGGGLFRTNLDSAQQRKGNYGIVFTINFTDNVDGSIITKDFVIDVNNMKGNPYGLINNTRQVNIFDIDSENFVEIKTISLFAKNFPETEEDKEDDIFFSNFELYATRALSQEELSEYSLKLDLNKPYFSFTDEDDSAITITGTVRIGKKEVDSANKNFEYYWFKQNGKVDIKDQEYSYYGGAGWECVNSYNIIDSETEDRTYVSSNFTLSVSKEDCTAAHNIYKLVVVFTNGKVVSNTIDIRNYDCEYTLNIESDQGTIFYYDNGNPSLKVTINGEDNPEGEYSYIWSREDNNGQVIKLEETSDINSKLKVAQASYNLLMDKIAKGSALPAASEEELNSYLTEIEKYSTMERVEGNKIFNIDLTQIKDYAIFSCSVYADNKLVGVINLKIENITIIEGEYNLSIENGIQTFNYNAAGVAPTNSGLEKPITLDILKLCLIDSKGNKVPDRIVKACEIVWDAPANESLIENFTLLEDGISATYTLADKYDRRKLDNNNIEVDLNYKTLSLHASTSFTFVKDGEPGTNGTDIICKIVPNTEEELEYYPTVYNGSLNYTPSESGKWLKVQLWENGLKIWEGYESTSGITVKWEVLGNNYGNNQKDTSTIAVSNNGTFSYNGYDNTAASIVKATVKYKDLNLYATMPVLTAETFDNNYNINLIKDSGFNYVMYDSDGRNPKYDNGLPFEIKVTQRINGFIENITQMTNQYKVTYNWSTHGSKYINNEKVDDLYLIQTGEVFDSYKATFVPKDEYNGEVINNAIEVKVHRGTTEIAKLYIPIHFYLNRYGIAALNDWDGNKITLNDDEGAILAPQVGAGIKNESNQFTGVLMGAVRESGNDNTEQGLFGYHEGQRTIFLDAQTGTSKFGKNGKGQIILDPTLDTAEIKSGNYSTTDKTGMLIDLTTPKIEFGSGKFKVNSAGIVTATDVDLTGKITASSGKIGNWTINNGAIKGTYTTLTSDGKITASSVDLTGKITATSGKIADYTISGAQLIGNNVGLSGTSGQGWAFWAGSNDPGNAPFHVGHDGSMYATSANITGTVSGSTVTGSTITGGSINITTGGSGYLRAGLATNHVSVSGLNVDWAGISSSAGITSSGIVTASGFSAVSRGTTRGGSTPGTQPCYFRRVKPGTNIDEGYYAIEIDCGIITSIVGHTS